MTNHSGAPRLAANLVPVPPLARQLVLVFSLWQLERPNSPSFDSCLPSQAQPYGAYPQQAQAQQRQPGLLAQMAATASSVAVGSTVGHGLSNMLFGGRSEAPVEQQAPPQQQYAPQNSGLSCDFQAKGGFTKCMENGDINTCGWYLEQLKACQAAARPY
ncbi:chch domain protein [Rhizoctonia solani]|uniref:Chch domain protein n=1 Tax=Rhizoctonia solani TaxID=456999 RepID=A0A8H7INH7_9AGAM|nr:chch domain protein [Rhizoctonia solani]